MSINITMPALSPTMEEGKLAKWHVKEGDSVSSGDVIAEIETDKATMEVEAVDEGKIGKIVVPEGTDNVKVNAVIAVLLTEGESAADVKAPAAPKAAEAPKPPAPVAAPAPVTTGTAAIPAKEVDARAQVAQTIEIARSSAANANGARIFASPLARRFAKEANIDISAIAGSGPHGRVVKSDVEAAKSGKTPLKAAPAAAPTSGGALAAGMSKAQVMALFPEGSYDVVPNDGMRKTVAARLTEAKQTIPHFYLTLDCRIDALMEAREKINAAAPLKDGKPVYKLSVNDFVIKAWAMALQRVPTANATWAVDSILYHKRSDVAVAVAVPGGLFTPVVKSADQKTLRQISDEVKDLAGRARNKKLAPHEYQGGSTSVSNLGMYGITQFSAVINPPHGTILAVGVGEERVYADKGQVKVGQFMTVTCACDHRAVDGALGAELLAAFKALIETPVMMLA
ncbi:MAG: pyruvate dehydrogenase complex dihydrolipoamide acetyltransferase [Devosia sp. 67-54]|uniref:pyruvate dehydrogenase complex dihydrolipoamide acetyltransferase n=1 Tax=unclassified Devosia TaxID=196773 RepID=UPI00086E248B|nr:MULTISPECIES: pyruvate dehydrogenase complex dihydrolipoamide acetyltransferase [unclassified Devosia]MBN9304345.1 pyruvate dehydrogenase complex dihydrolipoamide acetyltransferase [Devosia sp.]ODU62502.1 MAG: pyruvate dehydrogenase complex dihydrolipoamide acetyltransferase [Pelagibacterium sp. SCN 68-10]OJX18150.1 MAG: pyruvate dehydrogenase complex dihydrolipoamide acetyltransferase [Devosia sp. 67-54]